eukprot:70143_1
MTVTPTNNTMKVFVFTVCGCSLAALPFVIFFYHRFRQHSEFIMIQKRHPKILKVQAMISISCFAFVYPLMLLDFAELDEFNGSIQTVISFINRLSFPFIGPYGVFLCISWRFWHIYYDLKYNSSQKNSEWKYHLDPALVEHNFWLSHKATFGSRTWTRKPFFLYYFISSALTVIAYQIDTFMHAIGKHRHDQLVGHGATLFFSTVPVAIIFLLWKQIPQYSDNFFVKEELQMVAIGSIISVPFSIGAVAYGLSSSTALLICIMITYVAILFFMGSAYSFFYIPFKIRAAEKEVMLAKLTRSNSAPSVMRVISNSRSGSNSGSPADHDANTTDFVPNDKIDRIVSRLSHKLPAVLSNSKTFKLFMQHLAKEFSTECLLCFAEVLQYKFCLKQRTDLLTSHILTAEAGFVELCPLSDVVPLSVVVRSGFEQDLNKYRTQKDKEDVIITALKLEAKQVCFALYNKYIAEGAELEVNIAYEMRRHLHGLMSIKHVWFRLDVSMDDLFSIYDDVAQQMFRLMNGSFNRFQHKDTWQTICRILQEAHHGSELL